MIQKAEFWASHIAALKLEAIPVSKYARRHNLAVKSLYYWRRKLEAVTPGHHATTKTTQSVPGNKFVALQVATPRQAHCTLSLPSGLRLEISALPSPDWLAAFARATQFAQGVC